MVHPVFISHWLGNLGKAIASLPLGPHIVRNYAFNLPLCSHTVGRLFCDGRQGTIENTMDFGGQRAIAVIGIIHSIRWESSTAEVGVEKNEALKHNLFLLLGVLFLFRGNLDLQKMCAKVKPTALFTVSS